MITLPQCSHRGPVRSITRRCHCRHPERPDLVAFEDCEGCPFAGTSQVDVDRFAPKTAADLPCTHRSAEPVRTAACRGCQNGGRTELPVYHCAVHGECIIGGQPEEPIEARCLTCNHREDFGGPGAADVLVTAALDGITGYGQLAIAACRQLRARGLAVEIVPGKIWEPWDSLVPDDIRDLFVASSRAPVELLIGPPVQQVHVARRRRTIQFTMWESGRLDREAVAALNRRDAVIVPCRWLQQMFDAAGVRVPIYRIPLGCDPATFRSDSRFPVGTVFGAAARMAHGGVRKGIQSTVEAFQAAFPEDPGVRLEIKLFPDCDFADVDDPRIRVIRECWPDERLAEWYRSLTAFVTLSHAEGFGLMPLQAMSCGRPVILIPEGGHAEYFTTECGWPVAAELARADGASQIYRGFWWRPHEPGAVAALRAAHAAGTAELICRGTAASARAGAFTWERFGDLLADCLRPENSHA